MNKIEYGVSVSQIVCDAYGQSSPQVIADIYEQTGIARFRLMSYWSLIEQERGVLDFDHLDQQIKAVEKIGGTVTLCLGLRQPRWPECHPPKWLEEVEVCRRNELLMSFIEQVVMRYKDNECITSYQLENEALNHGIGLCKDFDRARLRAEYSLVKRLDDTRPIVMTTSNSWGLPFRRPAPDSIGFSYYLYEWGSDAPTNKPIPWQLHWIRRFIAKWVFGRHSFCHELQAEPWGPVGNEDLSDQQQQDLMDADRLKRHIEYAQKTGIDTIDLWGAEWWLHRKMRYRDDSLLAIVKAKVEGTK